MILSAAMLLDRLRERRGDTATRAAARIEQAVAAVRARGSAKTRDIGGRHHA